MLELYEVRTKPYFNSYHVMAKSFNEAKFKVEQKISSENENSIIDENGNLRKINQSEYVYQIEYLGKNFIP